MKTKFLALFLALTTTGTIAASDTKIGDIWYNLDEGTQTAEVTFKGDAGDRRDNRYTGAVNIPATVTYQKKTYNVTSIGANAFLGCRNVTSVKLPNSITSIGGSAFSLCYDLSKINIPESVTSIGETAFSICLNLTDIEIPATVTSVGSGAFRYVPNVIYNGSLNTSEWAARSINGYVDGYLVYENENKTKLLACAHLAKGKINLPTTLIAIGKMAFYYCTELDALTVPNSVTTIETNAFTGCTAMSPLVVPNSVATIGASAFNYVLNVKYEGSLTNSTNWGAKGFNGFVDGNLVYEDEEHTILCGASSKLIGNINLPNTVKKIGKKAFASNFSKISSVMMGSSVEEIGAGAFFECPNLTTVVIPATVKSIGTQAFDYCYGITSFTCEANIPPTCGSTILTEITKDGKTFIRHRIYVPANSVDDYKSQWSSYYKDSIFAITAENVKVPDSKIIVDPVTDISASIKWPKRDEAVTYTVKIELDDAVKFNYVFDNEGQLATTAFGAPGKDGDTRGVVTAARAIADGWIYVFEGLEPNSNYKAIVKAEDASSVELYEYSTTFRTLKRQAIDQVSSDKVQCTKELRDGQLLIRRGDKTYTVSGQVIE